MKQSKKIAWNLAREMSLEELTDREGLKEQLYVMADVSDDFRNSLIEIGIKEIAKQCRRYAQGFEECDVDQGKEKEETWTFQEVQSIVNLVRAGKSVQIAPYDMDVDDDPYVYRQRW